MSGIAHLSTRCARCGDSASMPPMSEPVYVASEVRLSAGSTANLYSVLHVCPNSDCVGAVIGYYSRGARGDFTYEYHIPQYRKYIAHDSIPERPRTILQDANDSKNSPVACAGAAVRALEAMLAEKGYKKRSDGLMKRIKQAVEARLLPQPMADWAQEVRVIGNETHTDDSPAPLPGKEDAEHVLEFANMLATYLFVLPEKIKNYRGEKAKKKVRSPAEP